MTPNPLSRVDRVVGRAVELTVEAHHRRRLRRLGRGGVLDPARTGPWADDVPPPRAGNRLEVLIDGAEALPRIAEALAAAKSHVHITGWHISPHFELVRDEPPIVLGALLAELAERIDVRILVWAGAPLPAFHPTRKEVAADVDRLIARLASSASATRASTPFTVITRRRS